MSRTFFWLLVSMIVALVPSVARASENFPRVFTEVLSIPAPPCTVCHASESGGKGTVTRAFGKKLVESGLQSGDTQMLATLLVKMRDNHDDSDHDNVSDIDELVKGTDPNINDITGEPAEDYPPPVYGCQAGGGHRRAPATSHALPFVAGALVAALWLRIRKSRVRMDPRFGKRHLT